MTHSHMRFHKAGVLRRTVMICAVALALCLTMPAWPASRITSAMTGTEEDMLPTGQHSYTFESKSGSAESIRRKLRLNYWLFLPRSYGQDPDTRWPLLLFLHGSREAGRDINRVRNAILPQIVDQQPDFPFIVLSPQSPTSSTWDSSIPAIIALLDDLQARLAIDPDRVYLTGLSLGGFGAWALARAQPERFAAIVPVVGGYYADPRLLCPLKDIPIWVFHGTKDWNVPFRQSERVVKALQACGGNPRFTIYEGADHDEGWRRAYNDPKLYEWLLQQRRRSGEGDKVTG